MSTPLICRPFDVDGADLVVHSLTKYYGGHSDVTCGVLIMSKSPSKLTQETFERARETQTTFGACPSPFDCWMVLRGIRSMSARLRVQSDNAFEIAKMLSEKNEFIKKVYYPNESLEEYGWKESTLKGKRGGVVSFRVRGGGEAAREVVRNCKLFENATSLGSTESLIELRAEVEGEGSTVPDDLIRLSVGLECVEELKEDLERAITVSMA